MIHKKIDLDQVDDMGERFVPDLQYSTHGFPSKAPKKGKKISLNEFLGDSGKKKINVYMFY